MHPAEAIKICLIDKYLCFRGRASRSEFWWFVIGTVQINILFFFGIITGPLASLSKAPFLLLIPLFLLPALITVTVRRFHDMNRSGFWILSFLFLDLLLLFLFSGTLGRLPNVLVTPSPSESFYQKSASWFGWVNPVPMATIGLVRIL